jgi:hypothetical protein
MAVTTARMMGWKTESFRERFFFHYRHLGTAKRSVLSSWFSYGEKDYYLGGHPVWELFRVAYWIAFKPPFIIEGVAVGLGYCWGFLPPPRAQCLGNSWLFTVKSRCASSRPYSKLS